MDLYEIVRNLSIITRKGLRYKGDTFDSRDLSDPLTLESLREQGIIVPVDTKGGALSNKGVQPTDKQPHKATLNSAETLLSHPDSTTLPEEVQNLPEDEKEGEELKDETDIGAEDTHTDEDVVEILNFLSKKAIPITLESFNTLFVEKGLKPLESEAFNDYHTSWLLVKNNPLNKAKK